MFLGIYCPRNNDFKYIVVSSGAALIHFYIRFKKSRAGLDIKHSITAGELFIRHFSNYNIVHRSALAAWAACLDPRLEIPRNRVPRVLQLYLMYASYQSTVFRTMFSPFNTLFFSKNNVDSDFMLLEHCQEILIKEITKQPTNGMIHINKDRRSVRYDTGAYTIADVGVQYFKYSVEISPSTVNQLVHEGEVTLDFRGKPMIFTPVCMAKEQELPLTKER